MKSKIGSSNSHYPVRPSLVYLHEVNNLDFLFFLVFDNGWIYPQARSGKCESSWVGEHVRIALCEIRVILCVHACVHALVIHINAHRQYEGILSEPHIDNAPSFIASSITNSSPTLSVEKSMNE